MRLNCLIRRKGPAFKSVLHVEEKVHISSYHKFSGSFVNFMGLRPKMVPTPMLGSPSSANQMEKPAHAKVFRARMP